MNNPIKIIGGGLAGCEAAYQIAKRGIKVKLYEMRPVSNTNAHHTDKLAELVCSNSLKSNLLDNAAGLLKSELRVLDSLLIKCADKTAVNAGHALAVDRELFSQEVTNALSQNPLIEIVREEVTELDNDEITIIASGPLTSDKLAKKIRELLGTDHLYFYDAAAPLIKTDSINFDIAYFKSRYDKGDANSYLNLPMTREQFNLFYKELIRGETVPLKSFEKEIYFEGCLPIEVIAKRGPKTLLYGPLKPIGLEQKDKKAHAVVQLRQDNVSADIYNLVGFQTNLTFKEQARIFRLIPGLENAIFERFGVMHRNTFICSPLFLNKTMQLRTNQKKFFAGQIVGVEGYVESIASGLIAGINAANQYQQKDLIAAPTNTMLGALLRYVECCHANTFQPINANYGIIANGSKKEKLAISEDAIASLKTWISNYQ